MSHTKKKNYELNALLRMLQFFSPYLKQWYYTLHTHTEKCVGQYTKKYKDSSADVQVQYAREKYKIV